MAAKKISIVSNGVLAMAGCLQKLALLAFNSVSAGKSTVTAALNYGLFCDSACMFKQSCVQMRVLTGLQRYIKSPC